MKIYLFLSDKLLTFSLPKDISGSYSFDFDDDEESKLINIEARDSKWVLYSTGDSSIVRDNLVFDSVELSVNNFYTLKRENIEYLVYVEDTKTNNLLVYQYGDSINLVIGNTSNCNVKYDFGITGEIEINIMKNNNILSLKRIMGNVYVNGFSVNDVVNLNIGDLITIFGFKVTILANIILFNYFSDRIPQIDVNSGIVKYSFPNDEEPTNVEIKDVDLYNQNDYYSKSPRIRRFIETKTIKLDSPPNEGESREMPLILTIGPMITMGATSVVTIVNTLSRAASNHTPISEQIPTLVMSGAMLVSMLVWPLVTRLYNKHANAEKKKEILDKYTKYLNEKKVELANEEKLQRDIISENLLTVSQCIEIINQRKFNFWDKRVDQNDFLVARIGIGDQKLDVDVVYPESGFTIEEGELKKKADALVEEYKYIKNIPVSYSFYENLITAIMGNDYKTVNFINNIILQLITYYTYEDLKLVVFTNKNHEHNWDYIRYLNHNFDNDKRIRFFASDNDSAKQVLDYLNFELDRRINVKDKDNYRPHYLIIVDDYGTIKRHEFIKKLTEQDDNLGFNMIIRENLFKNLPSKCDNFITLNDGKSGILKNSFEKQEQISFNDEIIYNVNMMSVAKILSNIPIEFEEGTGQLPDSISFLEMEKVGKVEQLNILNRWNTNDSTASIKAEVGVDEQGELMYLDLHEKHHGPHGLIAGTTGSGKSEFIITYILSMCVNYSPDDVSFILIDYKGGGLALAFENKSSGVILPHLAGTITNLDKAEMDRTLVSIDSEVKRRQGLFNSAKDKLGESTMDIYKYQRHFHEGRLDVPITHLFIICDEFAELKSQQPDFMDNLISVARIGRSLGVHLILATQKPSGVVNDQIWSNTRFRVCLKVQDESDSKEMLKKPDAAYIKQTGRYYLQVGYDEYYALGQSGWCGAKYYPSNKIVKQVDKSINFINDCGQFIKSIQSSSGNRGQAQGEQISNIMKNIIDVANQVGKKAKRLWLDNIPETILLDEIEKKYNIQVVPYNVETVVGEYDAPELQEQGVVTYNLLNNGNTIIYGNDGSERELMLSSIIYGLSKNHTAEEVNIYTIDYGSESLRRFQNLPQVGGMIFQGEDEEYSNFLKMLKEEMVSRKKKFIDYGGEYKNYIKNSFDKLPVIAVIINNFDSIYEANQNVYEQYPDLIRDSERYGIVFILTCSGTGSVSAKLVQNFSNFYAYKLKDQYDYMSIFNKKTKLVPRETFGRGLLINGEVHEFQTVKIMDDEDKLNAFLKEFVDNENKKTTIKAKKVPKLPEIVRFDDVKSGILNLSAVPIGILKKSLELACLNMESSVGLFVSSNKMINMKKFTLSFLQVLKCINNSTVLVIDPKHELMLDSSAFPNYYYENLDAITDQMIEYIKSQIDSSNQNIILCIYNYTKYSSLLDKTDKFTSFISDMKAKENLKVIIFDEFSKIKSLQYDTWVKDAFTVSEGVWIGKGIVDQNIFKIPSFSKEMTQEISNNMGYIINENNPTLCKLIDFVSTDDDNNS